MKIIGANVTGSFILNSQDVTTTIQTSNVWSGSVATDITALNASTASLNRATASLNAATSSLLNYTASNNAAISDILLETASFNAFSSSILNYTASNNAAISDILLETASFNAFSSSILNYTSSTNAAISDILLETASINLLTASLLSYTSSQNNRNGTYATTGSNTFTGVQTVNSNLVVTGSITAQTLVVQTITSSQNFVTGSTKFGSLAINTHQFTGSVIVTGSLNATAFTGSGAGLTSIPNAALTNSTISGIALGSNLATLTISTGLSGTSYNGSGAVTIANTGVTSIVAGTGISINQGTGAVTVTNSITNNNQLTNGAGYITSAGNTATATNLSTDRTNWSTNGTLTAVVGQLAWKNYGNNHTIIDASAGTAPNGASINATNANTVWTSSYPTLMGWNGSSTYGVRVDSARISDNTSGNSATTSQTSFSSFSATGGIQMRRDLGAATGISWYTPSYYNWQEYMALAGATGCGPNANLTAPSGLSAVTSWALRSRMEGVSTYGWIWETSSGGGGDASASPKMELGATNGTLQVSGDMVAYASDGRLKTNVKEITNSLDKIKAIRGVEYDWVDDIEEKYGFHPTSKHEVGVIAQEIQKVLPEAVLTAPFNGAYKQKYNEDPNFLTVKYERIVPLLIEAIKEQQSQIEELKTIINGLTK